MAADLEILETNALSDNPSLRAGIAALRKNKKDMFDAIEEARHGPMLLRHLREFPVFEDYRDDPDFMKLAELEDLSSDT